MKEKITKIRKIKLQAVIMAVVMLVLDQISKWLVDWFLPRPPAVTTVIPYVIDFRYVQNEGAAFGWFSDQRWIFLVSTTVFLVIAIYAFFSLKIEQKLVNFALMLIVSGGIGNMIDRIFRGFVIDFINFTFVDFFVFNIADCCVVVGCALFVLYLIIDSLKEKRFFGSKDVGSDSSKR